MIPRLEIDTDPAGMIATYQPRAVQPGVGAVSAIGVRLLTLAAASAR